MARRLPPLSCLRAFDAAARLGSFKAAAEELLLTPSAVSRSIQVLEDWLGAALFHRGNRSIALTEAGAAYAAQVRQALDRLATATDAVPGRYGPARLHLSGAPTFTRAWLMPRLARFRAEHPRIEILLDAAHRQVDLPRDGVDLAIRMGSPPWPGLEAQQLVAEELVPVCAPALASRLRRPEDLATVALLHVANIATDWSWWLAAREVALPRDAPAPMRFDTVQLAQDAALQGLGVALGRRPVVDPELEAGRLAAVLGPPVAAGSGYWLLWQPEAAQRPEVRAFLNWIRLDIAAEPAAAVAG